MNSEIAKVCEFMVHMDSPPMQLLAKTDYPDGTDIYYAAHDLSVIAKDLAEKAEKDPRAMRAWLMAEELTEVLDALSEQDEVALLDGLADLLYVLIGTAVQFDLPLAEAFDAVHESNMTKKAKTCMKTGYKDVPGYKPPDLAKILEAHRCKR